jgi:hypothetical protein
MRNFSLFLIGVALLLSSCAKDECKDVTCNNGGTCAEGSCACPVEWQGSKCSDLNINGVLTGGSFRKWKIASLSDAATGSNIPVSADNQALRFTFKSDNSFIYTTTDTVQNIKWELRGNNVWLVDPANPSEALELRSYKWNNSQFSFRWEKELLDIQGTGDVEIALTQTN